MRIVIGSDHRGYEAANRLMEHLQRQGHQVQALGACTKDSCDYPDSAYQVGKAVADHRADVGILACSNGVGMSIAANKIPGVRAALVYDEDNARRSREHNNANVLCLGGETGSQQSLNRIVDAWLDASFEAGGRHDRRVKKIAAIERGLNPLEQADASSG